MTHRSARATRTLLVGALLGVACDSASAPPPGERVVAVTAQGTRESPTREFCERYTEPAQARRFEFPPVVPAAPTLASRLTWVNVWATWCVPCVEEIPLLRAWEAQLAREGRPTDFVFLSVDEDAQALAAFPATHPGFPTEPRIADQAAAPAFLQHVGLDPGATIPIHVLLDREQRTRCVRTGSVSREHYGVAKAVLGAL